jgi:membrane protease YdiL (CAAX protease family)
MTHSVKRRRPPRLAFALRDRRSLFDDRERGLAARLSVAYLAMAALGGGLAASFVEGGPWTVPAPWIELPSLVAASASASAGVALAFLLVVSSRYAMARAAWAGELAEALSPIASRLSDRGILAVALLSSMGEELLFRALLVPHLGVIGSSLLFGVIHQVRGPARWVWVAWATAAGLGFAALLQGFGSIVGPVVAHATVNAANLAFLRAHASRAAQATAPLERVDQASRPPDPHD